MSGGPAPRTVVEVLLLEQWVIPRMVIPCFKIYSLVGYSRFKIYSQMLQERGPEQYNSEVHDFIHGLGRREDSSAHRCLFQVLTFIPEVLQKDMRF